MARAEGVVIVSERFWAFAGTDGSLREGTMPSPPNSLRAIPLARGLVRLSASLSPLFRRQGVARKRERIFLLAAIVTPLALAFAPSWIGLIAGLVTTVALLCWLLRGRTLYLHGAEHRAIAALEERRLRETWHGAASPSRFSLRCGTNFAALMMPVAVLGGRVWPLPATAFTPVVVSVLALALTMELWQLVQSVPVWRAWCSCRVSVAATHHARAAARRNTVRSPRSQRCSAASFRTRSSFSRG
jgi:hypothetical protein